MLFFVCFSIKGLVKSSGTVVTRTEQTTVQDGMCHQDGTTEQDESNPLNSKLDLNYKIHQRCLNSH